MQVSRAAALLDEELEAWRNRPLSEIPYLILDARYEKIRHGGSVVPAPCWWRLASPDGRRSVLGVSVSLSEAEVHWREFLASLQDRGLHGVRYIVSDDHAGLKQARQARFSGVPWQRCQFHLMQNAMHYVPKVSMRAEVARDLRAVLDAGDRVEAERQLGLVIKKYARGPEARRLARSQRPRSAHRARAACGASLQAADHEHARTDQQGNQTTDTSRHTVPQRGGGCSDWSAPCWWKSAKNGRRTGST